MFKPFNTLTFDWSPLFISLQTAATATLMTVILGILAAKWMLTYRGRWQALVDGILISPLVLPPTVVGFLLLLIFGRNSPVGQLLSLIGIKIVFSWWATVIAATVVSFPVMYRTTLGSFQQIDSNILHAARTLGSPEWEVFVSVLLPLAKPGILAATTLSFARALGEFGATLMLAGNLPGRTQTIPMAIYFASEAGNFQTAFIWVMIILVISVGGITLLNWYSRPRQVLTQSDPSSLNRSLDIPLNSSSPDLQVWISKTLEAFPLNIKFTASRLGLLGASGSGKSMTLRCIAGLENPDQGQIILNNRILFDSSARICLPSHQRRIGVVFQNYALFPHLTVAENITFGLRRIPISQRSQRQQFWIQKMHLQGLENRYPGQLSGGQQQRVALARALAPEPEALLLDEPFSALDTHLRSQIEQHLATILETFSGSVLLVTHNLEEAYRLCPKLLVLVKGQKAAWGSREEILSHPPTVTVARLTGCKNIAEAGSLMDPGWIDVPEWECQLRIPPAHSEKPVGTKGYIGIRAHHLSFGSDGSENTFPCWLAKKSETPFRMTLFLRLHQPPAHDQDYHLQAEVFKERWFDLEKQSFPWRIHLDQNALFWMDTV